MKEQIKTIIDQKGNTVGSTIISNFRKYAPELIPEINNLFLEYHLSFSEKIYWIINDINQPPTCNVCGNKVKFKGYQIGYDKNCSRKCAANDPLRKHKIRKTNLQRYGDICPLNNDIIKQKKFKTLNEKYHVNNIGELRKSAPKMREKFFNSLTIERLGNCEPLFDSAFYIQKGRNYYDYPFKCLKCNHQFNSYLINGHIPKCPHCFPIPLFSTYETEIINEIKKFYNGIILRSNRSVLKTLELDIYIPEHKIAFEIDGLYWHSDIFKHKNYHLEKTIKCNNEGIRLIHIFEDEWLEKKDIVINRIKHLLHKDSNKIYARKCFVKEINNDEKDQFLEKYHLQGKDNSLIKLGLYYKEELVAVMSFGKSRYSKNAYWELVRYATISDKTIVGGGSKLLAYFQKYHHESMITYADLRWSDGNFYQQLGFTFSHNSKPNYFYIKRDKRFSRLKFQKHKLKKKLTIFNESLSEYKNMENNGFYRIWDCGNMVFIYNKKEAN